MNIAKTLFVYRQKTQQCVVVSLFLCVFLFIAAQNHAVADTDTDTNTVNVNTTTKKLSHLPLVHQEIPVDWMNDPNGTLTIEDVQGTKYTVEFMPGMTWNAINDINVLWIRIPLHEQFVTPDTPKPLLDLARRVRHAVPIDTTVWFVPQLGKNIQQLTADDGGLFPIPTGADGTLYIRTVGSPSFGFAPVIRSANTRSFFDAHADQLILGLLIVALGLNFVRGIMAQREWRIWAAFYSGTLFVLALWTPPVLSLTGRIQLAALPALLAPAVAIFLLAHIGRLLMRTRTTAPKLDLLFIIQGTLALGIALLPLVTRQTWMLPYLQLWPLLTLLSLSLALVAVVIGLPGAVRFACVCTITPLGLSAILPLPSIDFITPEANVVWYSFLSLVPELTLCFGALLLGIIPSPHLAATQQKQEENNTNQENNETLPTTHAAVIPKKHTKHETEDIQFILDSLTMLEQQLREPMDNVLVELHALSHMPLPNMAKEHVKRLLLATNHISELMYDETLHISGLGDPALRPAEEGTPRPNQPFDLHNLIHKAHNAVVLEAEAKNVALSWYTAPQLNAQYFGDPTRLLRVLTLLAESAVAATNRGVVQIRVQRVLESNDPGHLLFSITDTGTGMPPAERNTMAMIRAWEFAGTYGGALEVSSAASGTTVSFTLRLRCVGHQETLDMPLFNAMQGSEYQRVLRDALRVFVVSAVPNTRQILTYFLDELPHDVCEARSMDEVLAMYTQTPGALLIFDGDLIEEDLIAGIAAIRAFEGEQSLPLTSFLLLANDDEQAERLRRAGCTHALLKPVTRKELRRITLRLAPIPQLRKTEIQMPQPKEATSTELFVALPIPPLLNEEQQHLVDDHTKTVHPEQQQPEQQQPESTTSHQTKNKRVPTEELVFLQPPTLQVRSHVGEPKPLVKKHEKKQQNTTTKLLSETSVENAVDTPLSTMNEQPLPDLQPPHDVLPNTRKQNTVEHVKSQSTTAPLPKKLQKLAKQAISRAQAARQLDENTQLETKRHLTAIVETSNNDAQMCIAETQNTQLSTTQSKTFKAEASEIQSKALKTEPFDIQETMPQAEQSETQEQTLKTEELEHQPFNQNEKPTDTTPTETKEQETSPHLVTEPSVIEDFVFASPTQAEETENQNRRIHLGTVDDFQLNEATFADMDWPTARPRKKRLLDRLLGWGRGAKEEKKTDFSYEPISSPGEWVGEPRPVESQDPPATPLLPNAPDNDAQKTLKVQHVQPKTQTTSDEGFLSLSSPVVQQQTPSINLKDEAKKTHKSLKAPPLTKERAPTDLALTLDIQMSSEVEEHEEIYVLEAEAIVSSNQRTTEEMEKNDRVLAENTRTEAQYIVHAPAGEEKNETPSEKRTPEQEQTAAVNTADESTISVKQEQKNILATDAVEQTASALVTHQSTEEINNVKETPNILVEPQSTEEMDSLLQGLVRHGERAEQAFAENNLDDLGNIATELATAAQHLGLPSLADLALCMAEEALSGQQQAVEPLLQDIIKQITHEQETVI